MAPGAELNCTEMNAIEGSRSISMDVCVCVGVHTTAQRNCQRNKSVTRPKLCNEKGFSK